MGALPRGVGGGGGKGMYCGNKGCDIMEGGGAVV